MQHQSSWTGRNFLIGTVGSGIFTNGTTLTFSVYGKAVGSTQKIYCVLWNTKQNKLYRTLISTDITEKFLRYSTTFTVNNTGHNVGDSIHLYLYGPYTAGMSDGYNYYLQPQLETASTATSFCPSSRESGKFVLPPTIISRTDFAIGMWVKIYALSSNNVIIDKTTNGTDGFRVYLTNDGKLRLKVGTNEVVDSSTIGSDWFYILLYGTANKTGLRICDQLGYREISLNSQVPINSEKAFLTIGNSYDFSTNTFMLFSQLSLGYYYDKNGVAQWTRDVVEKIYNMKQPFDTLVKSRIIPFHQHDSMYLRHYNGYVGIGTDSPLYMLDVRQASWIDSVLTNQVKIGATDQSNYRLYIKESTSNSQIFLSGSNQQTNLQISLQNNTITLNASTGTNVQIGSSTKINISSTNVSVLNSSLKLPDSGFNGSGQIQCTGTVKFANGGQAQGIYVKEIAVSDSWADNDANKQTNGIYSKGNLKVNTVLFVNAQSKQVGVNTTSPQTPYQIHVNGATLLSGNVDIIGSLSTQGNVSLKNSSGNQVITVSNSNVGINVSSPSETLHVNGAIRGHVNGALRISTGSGTLDIGPQNTSVCRLDTSVSRFYFNKPVNVQTELQIDGTSYKINSSAFYLPGGTVNGIFSATTYVQTPEVRNSTNLTLYVNGYSTIMTSTGRIGLLTSNPLEQIHLNGQIRGNSTNGSIRIKTDYGYVDIGATTSTGVHFTTNVQLYAFNKQITQPAVMFSNDQYQYAYYINQSGYANLSSVNATSGTFSTSLYQQTANFVNVSISGTLTSGTLNMPNSVLTAKQISITQTSPLPPLSVNSSILVVNLNQDLLDGMHQLSSNSQNTVVSRDSTGNFQANVVVQNKVGTNTAQAFNIITNNSNVITVTSDGKVGIGTTSPEEKLHVYGPLKGNQTNGAVTVKTNCGSVTIGAQNYDWCHFLADNQQFYFNKPIHAVGSFTIYDTSYGFSATQQKFPTTTVSQLTIVGIQTFNSSVIALLKPVNVSGNVNITGNITATRVYGAVYNDYQEYRAQVEYIKPGYVQLSNNGKLYKQNKDRQRNVQGVVSDVFGFQIGEQNQNQLPVQVSGRALVYAENKKRLKVGDQVCTTKNGTVRKMKWWEKLLFPEQIVGFVDEIPSYSTWGSSNVRVDGRIWIRVK